MEEKTTPAIVFDGVTKHYGSFRALNDLSFDVEEGSITGFVGPNGAGKTTSIRLIGGLLLPDQGSISIAGRNPHNSAEVRERAFFIMDTINIPPHMPIYDYFLHLSRIYRFDPSRIKDAFKSMDLWPARGWNVRQLSAGMKQKAQLAIALCAEADIIIADEPASNMDPTARMQLYETIRRINRESKTTFFISSHILAELERVIDRIIIIDKGRKLAQSKVSELVARGSKKYGENTVRIVVSDPTAASGVIDVTAVEGSSVIVQTEEGRIGQIISALEAKGISVISVERQRFDLSELFSEAVSNEQVS